MILHFKRLRQIILQKISLTNLELFNNFYRASIQCYDFSTLISEFGIFKGIMGTI